MTFIVIFNTLKTILKIVVIRLVLMLQHHQCTLVGKGFCWGLFGGWGFFVPRGLKGRWEPCPWFPESWDVGGYPCTFFWYKSEYDKGNFNYSLLNIKESLVNRFLKFFVLPPTPDNQLSTYLHNPHLLDFVPQSIQESKSRKTQE